MDDAESTVTAKDLEPPKWLPVGTVLILTAFVAWAGVSAIHSKNLAAFGDSFGWLTGVVTAVALLGTLYALHQQRKQLLMQYEEVKAQRLEFAAAREALERQAELADAQRVQMERSFAFQKASILTVEFRGARLGVGPTRDQVLWMARITFMGSPPLGLRGRWWALSAAHSSPIWIGDCRLGYLHGGAHSWEQEENLAIRGYNKAPLLLLQYWEWTNETGGAYHALFVGLMRDPDVQLAPTAVQRIQRGDAFDSPVTVHADGMLDEAAVRPRPPIADVGRRAASLLTDLRGNLFTDEDIDALVRHATERAWEGW